MDRTSEETQICHCRYNEGAESEPMLHDRPLSLLLVEDNLVNQKVALGLLRKLGLEVELAADGEIALQRCADKAGLAAAQLAHRVEKMRGAARPGGARRRGPRSGARAPDSDR